MLFRSEWFCPKCKWWINEEGLKYDPGVVACADGFHCPRDDEVLETRPAEFSNYARRACDKERRSLSMAIRPKDVPKAMIKWPGSRYTKNGVLLVSGRSEKKIRMKQRGLIELS